MPAEPEQARLSGNNRLPRMDLSSAGRSIPENVALMCKGETAGWGGAWVSELNGMEAVSMATAIAGSLKSGRVGSAILPVQTRDPLLIAMGAASIDQLSPGGFVLGLGVSTKLIIEDWHATPWGDSPLGLTREAVDLTRRFLAGERVTTETGRWRYNRAQLTAVPKRPVPIYIAALNNRMLQLAGEVADGVLLNFVSVNDLKHARTQIELGAARSGRSLEGFETMIFFRATVTDNYEQVKHRYQRELFTYVMAPVYQDMFAREGYRDACIEAGELWRNRQRDEALEAVPEALIRDRTLIGSPGEIAERLSEYRAAGLDGCMVFPVAVPDAEYVPDTERSMLAMAPGQLQLALG